MDRMGGVLVISDAITLSFNLQYTGDWHCDIERFKEHYQSDPRYLTNYTFGHEYDPNHAWHPVRYEIYPGNENTEYDALCVIKYAPNSPTFMRDYGISLQKFFNDCC